MDKRAPRDRTYRTRVRSEAQATDDSRPWGACGGGAWTSKRANSARSAKPRFCFSVLALSVDIAVCECFFGTPLPFTSCVAAAFALAWFRVLACATTMRIYTPAEVRSEVSFPCKNPVTRLSPGQTARSSWYPNPEMLPTKRTHRGWCTTTSSFRAEEHARRVFPTTFSTHRAKDVQVIARYPPNRHSVSSCVTPTSLTVSHSI